MRGRPCASLPRLTFRRAKYPSTASSTRSPCRRLTCNEYRYGSSGVHRWAAGIGTDSSAPAPPVAVATGLPPAPTVDRHGRRRRLLPTVSFNADPSTSGTTFSDATCVAGTGSSHTVCQMPVQAVYQMPRTPLPVRCLPIGCSSLVASYTFTSRSLSPACRAGVTSNSNGVYPPTWRPTSRPLTRTAVS